MEKQAGRGIGKITYELFEVVFEKLQDTESFVNAFFDEVEKRKPEFRLIFQIATSPSCGEKARKKSEDFKFVCKEYTEKLSKLLNRDEREIAPIIYLILSIIVDYVIWEDKEASKMQLECLYKIMTA